MQKSIFFLLIVGCVLAVSNAHGQSIDVVTYNIRYPNPGDGDDFWPHRAAAVGNFLKQYDVVGLQEAKFTQLGDLDPILMDFQRYAVGRDDGKQSGESTAIYFRKDRFELLDSGTIWLSPTPEKAGAKGWDAALPRILSWVMLKDEESAAAFIFANTHFDHRGREARQNSGELIQEFLSKKSRTSSTKSQHVPVVLLGDFNCLPKSGPYSAIIKSGSFIDARDASKTKVSGPQSTWCGFKAIADGKIIDHIFVTESVDVLGLETHDPKTKAGRFASDHLPVRARIGFAKQRN